MRVLGLISGTSHDGIDAAIVDFSVSGEVLLGRVVHVGTTPYPRQLRDRLVHALPPAAVTFAEVCALDTLVGQAFADVAAGAVAEAGPIDLVCSHGQTVFHWAQGRQILGTLQIGQPAWIAERIGTPVVADLRARDVAAGGQGAPLVPLMDSMLLAGIPGRPAGLNLGGIANVTILRPPAAAGVAARAFDIGPANALIDAAAIRATAGRLRFDEEGALGASGAVHAGLLAYLLGEPFYELAAPKTTGKELFNADYLDRAITRFPGVADADVVATVTELTARIVADQIHRYEVETVVASGGGCNNPTLMRALARHLEGVRLMEADEVGAPVDAKEAIAFALLGWCTAHGLPATVPSATGASGPRILGAIIPGKGPLRLPDPLDEAPSTLRLIR